MEHRSIKIAAIWCGILAVLALVVSESSIEVRLGILSADYAALSKVTEGNARRCEDLAIEASRWRKRAELMQNHPAPRQESRHELAASAHTWASDALDFDSEAKAARPALIISALPGGAETMRRNVEETTRYDRVMTTAFLKEFGGPLTGLMRKTRAYGVDTSRLQHHLAIIQSPIAIRLIANDLNDIADQLEPPVAHPPTQTPKPEPRTDPQARSTAAAGQE